MDAFLHDKVCPHIHLKFGGRVAVVLGKSLLWACKEPVMIPWVPACLPETASDASIERSDAARGGHQPHTEEAACCVQCRRSTKN